ncbi:type II toxin-antitoxin system RelE family toxin [Sandaracinobacteroides saxicola]|uniref:Type II toxin-antitoxin system RelE/ParE family toxin n=1 Tax=Sandaracinobacteroides saxicola TaxID=2759707 RepID=A0A7G5IIX5_9SPHN|nr:type II toxin-antitoxin system RelE/ParE family toxin [Sandaracinobacteroides saxicola]QMW23317.1 type II toxin-antitoxin system RelE/ParE family toxin [Sandaracinobacteroides saxicola]
MRAIRYSRLAERALKRMPRPHAERIVDKIELLASNRAALANQIKALKGIDAMRLRVGDYRVIFTETLDILAIVNIGPRGSIYE